MISDRDTGIAVAWVSGFSSDCLSGQGALETVLGKALNPCHFNHYIPSVTTCIWTPSLRSAVHIPVVTSGIYPVSLSLIKYLTLLILKYLVIKYLKYSLMYKKLKIIYLTQF